MGGGPPPVTGVNGRLANILPPAPVGSCLPGIQSQQRDALNKTGDLGLEGGGGPTWPTGAPLPVDSGAWKGAMVMGG